VANATGEAKPSPLRLTFDRRVQLEFHGARITLQTTVTEEQPDEPAADEAEEFEEPRRPPRLRLLNPETVRRHLVSSRSMATYAAAGSAVWKATGAPSCCTRSTP
jgi:hypothetical protein